MAFNNITNNGKLGTSLTKLSILPAKYHIPGDFHESHISLLCCEN